MITWIAQGFGIGYIRYAPGTFGSLLGWIWLLILVAPGSLLIFLLGLLAGIIAAVPICTEAERQLDQKDPSSVVIDEWVAFPVCFLSWILLFYRDHHALPALRFFWSGSALAKSAFVFLLFRLFDIWKPWPIRQIQRWHGGWGIVADDLFAAFYTNGVLWVLPMAG